MEEGGGRREEGGGRREEGGGRREERGGRGAARGGRWGWGGGGGEAGGGGGGAFGGRRGWRLSGGGRRESYLSKQGKRSMTRNMVTDHPKPNVAISGSHVSACDQWLRGLEDLGGEIWMGFGFDLGLLV